MTSRTAPTTCLTHRVGGVAPCSMACVGGAPTAHLANPKPHVQPWTTAFEGHIHPGPQDD